MPDLEADEESTDPQITPADPETTSAAPVPQTQPASTSDGHPAGAGQPEHVAPETHPVVAQATELLDRLPQLDTSEHPDLYQQIHAELQGALSAIDDA